MYSGMNDCTSCMTYTHSYSTSTFIQSHSMPEVILYMPYDCTSCMTYTHSPSIFEFILLCTVVRHLLISAYLQSHRVLIDVESFDVRSDAVMCSDVLYPVVLHIYSRHSRATHCNTLQHP